MELLKVSNKIWSRYRFLVNGNKEETLENCIKKLTRNYILSNKTYKNNGLVKCYYGNLTMMIDENTMTVLNIDNIRHSKPMSKIDSKKKEQLNLLLGIE